MPALSGHAAWRWYGMDGYNDSGNWRGGAMRSGGGSEPRVSWKGRGLPGCPRRTQVPLLLGPGCQGQATAWEFGVCRSSLSCHQSGSCWAVIL